MDHARETSHYDTLWKELTRDELDWSPQQLARAPDIQSPPEIHPVGGNGFVQWNEQKMLAEIQLARRRAALLAQHMAAMEQSVTAAQHAAAMEHRMAECS
jgi:hypothetical protein